MMARKVLREGLAAFSGNKGLSCLFLVLLMDHGKQFSSWNRFPFHLSFSVRYSHPRGLWWVHGISFLIHTSELCPATGFVSAAWSTVLFSQMQSPRRRRRVYQQKYILRSSYLYYTTRNSKGGCLLPWSNQSCLVPVAKMMTISRDLY